MHKSVGDIVFVEVETEGETSIRGKVSEPSKRSKPLKTCICRFRRILEFNGKLASNPDLLNKDPYGQGWVIRVRMTNLSEIENLLNSEAYKAHLDTL